MATKKVKFTFKEEPAEEGAFGIRVDYIDDADAAVTPDSATWTLTNDRGVVINNRLAVPITPVSTFNIVRLQAGDLEISDDGLTRHFLVEYVYNSIQLGSGTLGKADVAFNIADFYGVT